VNGYYLWVKVENIIHLCWRRTEGETSEVFRALTLQGHQVFVRGEQPAVEVKP
jgi:hypothetical protein